MKAKYWHRGEALDYVNATENKIEAGDVLTMGSRIGVAGTDIEPGGLDRKSTRLNSSHA